MTEARTTLVERTKRTLATGDFRSAIAAARDLLGHAHVSREDQELAARALIHSYERMGAARALVAVHLALGNPRDALAHALADGADAARCLAALGRHQDAARAYERAGAPARAAIQYEHAGDHRAARDMWEQLARSPALARDAYTRALVRYDLSRCTAKLGDEARARSLRVEAIQLLEEAADAFESADKRERAFDCYQVLLTLGRDGAFENAAEGYTSCIRVLREDGLKYYALQYFEDFQQLALARGELAAAAMSFRDAAEYCRGQHLPYEDHFRLRAAETLCTSARRFAADPTRKALAENAFAAAIDAFNEIGAHARIRGVYAELAALPLGERRAARYLKLAERLAEVPDEPRELTPFPSYLRMDAAYPEVWHLDVVEWELAGDPAETMLELLGDAKWPELTRRRALLAALVGLDAKDAAADATHLARVATTLAYTEVYVALAPLERLAGHPDANVRAACVRATRRLFFKRTFGIVEAALTDAVLPVRTEAIGALRALSFPQALEVLARIARRNTNAEVRHAALASMGAIATRESVELLVDVWTQSAGAERELVAKLLERSELAETEVILSRVAATLDEAQGRGLHDIVRLRRRAR